MQHPELNQAQREALWSCYALLLQRRAARLARERQAADEPHEEQADEAPQVSGDEGEEQLCQIPV